MDDRTEAWQRSVVPARLALDSNGPVAYQAFHLDGRGPVVVRQQDSIMSVSATSGEHATFRVSLDDGRGQLDLVGVSADAAEGRRLAMAAFEYLFSTSHALQSLCLVGSSWSGLLEQFTAYGLLSDS